MSAEAGNSLQIIPNEIVDELRSIGYCQSPEVISLLERIFTKFNAEKESQVRLITQMKNKIQFLRNETNQENQNFEHISTELRKKEEEISLLEKEKLEFSAEISRLKQVADHYSASVLQLNDEKKALNESLEKIQLEKDDLNDQVETLNEKFKSLSELNNSENELIDLRSKYIALQLQYNSLEQESKKLSNNLLWAENELDNVNKEFGEYRRQKNELILDLRSENDQKKSEAEQLKRSNSLLNESLNHTSKKLNDIENKSKKLQEQLIEAEENFKLEMSNQIKLNTLYKESLDDLQNHCNEISENNQSIQNLYEEAQEKLKSINEEYSQNITHYKKLLDEKDEQIENLLDQRASSSEASLAALSPTALIASSVQKSGKKFSEVYSDYQNLQADFLKEKRECERLRNCLNEVMMEVEQRNNIFKNEANNVEKLKCELAKIMQEYHECLLAKETGMKELNKLQSENKELKNSIQLSDQSIKDLSKQVQILLTEIDSSSQDETFSRCVPEAANVTVDSSQIISDKLLTFRNVHEMQNKNLELIKVIRELTSRYEQLQSEMDASHSESQSRLLESLNKELEELKESRKRHVASLEAVARQRDMYKDMYEQSKSDSSPVQIPSGELMTQQSEDISNIKLLFENYKKEKIDSEKLIQNQLERLRKENSDYRIQLGKTQATLEFIQERYSRLESIEGNLRNEIELLRTKNIELSTSALHYQKQLENLTDTVVQGKDFEKKLQLQISSLKSELTVSKCNFERASQDNISLLREKEQLSLLIQKIQAIHNEFEKLEDESKIRVKQEAQMYEKECMLARKKQQEIEEKLSILQARYENEKLESNQTISDLKDQISIKKEEIISLKCLNEEYLRKIQQVESKMYDGFNSTETVLPVPELSEIIDLKSEIKTLKEDLKNSFENANQYKAISLSNEEALENMSNAFDEYKSNMEIKLKEMQLQAKEYDKSLQVINYHEITIKKLENEREQLELELKSNQELMNSIQLMKQDYEEDIRRLQYLVDESNRKFENEIIAHASDLQQIIRLKEINQGLQEEITAVKEQHYKELSSNQIELSSAIQSKNRLDEEIIQLRQRMQELSNQNNILYLQIESLTSRIVKYDNDKNENNNDSDGSISQNDGENQLRQVIKYLRREKEILNCQVESHLQETRRFKAQINHLSTLLDEARANLEEEKKRNEIEDKMNAEYASLLEKVNQYNLLRESNVTLREELNKSIKASATLQEENHQLRNTNEPLQLEIKQLRNTIDSLAFEKEQLSKETQTWKDRVNNLLSSYERIDPNEHQKLKDENIRLQEELARLNSNSEELKSEHAEAIAKHEARDQKWREKTESLISKIKELRVALAESLSNHSTLQEELKLLQQSHTALVKEYEQAKQLYESAASKSTSEDSETVRNLEKRVDELTNEKTQLEADINERDIKLKKHALVMEKTSKIKDAFIAMKDEKKQWEQKLQAAVLEAREERQHEIEELQSQLARKRGFVLADQTQSTPHENNPVLEEEEEILNKKQKISGDNENETEELHQSESENENDENSSSNEEAINEEVNEEGQASAEQQSNSPESPKNITFEPENAKKISMEITESNQTKNEFSVEDSIENFPKDAEQPKNDNLENNNASVSNISTVKAQPNKKWVKITPPDTNNVAGRGRFSLPTTATRGKDRKKLSSSSTRKLAGIVGEGAANTSPVAPSATALIKRGSSSSRGSGKKRGKQ